MNERDKTAAYIEKRNKQYADYAVPFAENGYPEYTPDFGVYCRGHADGYEAGQASKWVAISERLMDTSGYYNIIRADGSITCDWISVPVDLPAVRLAKAWMPIPEYRVSHDPATDSADTPSETEKENRNVDI